MSAERSPYIPLLVLAVDWAAEAGMPKELVLRRLCEWAMAGAFPEGAFITATGAMVLPFDIYMSFRAATEDTGLFGSRGIDLDGGTIYNANDHWGMHVLAKVLVTASAVLEFCKRTNTLAPPSLLRGVSRFLARWGQTKHVAPPECPDADEHAARYHARDSATASMNSLRSMLSGLQGNPTRHGPQRVPGEPVDFEHWGAEWKKAHDRTQNEITRCGDSGLQQELSLLDAEWCAFVTQETRAVAENSGENQEKPLASPIEQTKRRGRPSGSGSYEPADAPIIEQMREALLKEPSLSPTAAAMRLAGVAIGAGTLESKAKRLAEGYSAKYGNQSR